MNIYNFIQEARKAWKEQTGLANPYSIGMAAIRIVEQEYEKTEIHNVNLLLSECKAELLEAQKDLIVERNKARKRHNELAALNTVIQSHKTKIQKNKEAQERLLEFATNVVASSKDSSNKLQLILNKIKNP